MLAVVGKRKRVYNGKARGNKTLASPPLWLFWRARAFESKAWGERRFDCSMGKALKKGTGT